MVLDRNPAAITLYRRNGYLLEGRHAGQLLINGQYVDDLSYAKHLTL